jgi:RNA polymerase sigma-70 factor (ECF subfamily)
MINHRPADIPRGARQNWLVQPFGAQRRPASTTLLIERLKAGDADALEMIFNAYSKKLYNVAWRILGDAADTEEVIQDVFWTVFRKAKLFQGHSQFSTWLYRLTVNAALGKIRRTKKTKKDVAYDEFLPKFQKDGHHLVRPVIDWSDTLDEKYANREMQELLGKVLDELKPLDKSVVVLSDLDGLSDKDIAAALGLTVSAVKTRLHRARLFLRGKMTVYLGHPSCKELFLWRDRKTANVLTTNMQTDDRPGPQLSYRRPGRHAQAGIRAAP